MQKHLLKDEVVRRYLFMPVYGAVTQLSQKNTDIQDPSGELLQILNHPDNEYSAMLVVETESVENLNEVSTGEHKLCSLKSVQLCAGNARPRVSEALGRRLSEYLSPRRYADFHHGDLFGHR